MTTQPAAATGETVKMYRVNAVNNYVLIFVLLILLPILAILPIAVAIRDFKNGGLTHETVLVIVASIGFGLISVVLARLYRDTSWLLLSRQGVEYHGRGIVIQTTWENVSEVTQSATPCLLLRAPAARFTGLGSSRDLFADQRIPLYRFDYAPNNPLGQDLRRFAPQLFH